VTNRIFPILGKLSEGRLNGLEEKDKLHDGFNHKAYTSTERTWGGSYEVPSRFKYESAVAGINRICFFDVRGVDTAQSFKKKAGLENIEIPYQRTDILWFMQTGCIPLVNPWFLIYSHYDVQQLNPWS